MGLRVETPEQTSTEYGHRLHYRMINGHRRAFVLEGSGPVLLLLHGIGCDHRTWGPVIDQLAKSHTVLVPDLLGHGKSDKPRADYSLGGYANGMRDLLDVLGIDSVTVVGHSFGGGVAMQFSYQFPGRCERIVLVSSGGMGREVTPFLRAVTLPGFHQVMGVLTLPGVRHLGAGWLRLLHQTHAPGTQDMDEVAAVYESFADPRARAATRHVVKGVIDLKGQVISMADRAYLASEVPTCVVWGAADRVIPPKHAQNAQVFAPWARVEVLAGSGHFPHKDYPEKFASIIEEFVAQTEPHRMTQRQWRGLLMGGADAAYRRWDASTQKSGAPRDGRTRPDELGTGSDRGNADQASPPSWRTPLTAVASPRR